MTSGAVILDLSASSLSAVAEKVADELLNKNEIRSSDRDGLLRALLMRRRYAPPPVVYLSLSIRLGFPQSVCSMFFTLMLSVPTVRMGDLWSRPLEIFRCRPFL